jgi:hypothetical protein
MDKSSLLFAGTMSTKGDSSGAFQLKHRSGTANVFNEEVMTQAALRLGLVKPSWLSPANHHGTREGDSKNCSFGFV